MTGPLTDTWFPRDLPVLTAAAKLLEDPASRGLPQDENGVATECPSLGSDEILAALTALTPTFLETQERTASGDHIWIHKVTAQGRRATGLWPAGTDPTTALVAALEAQLANTQDEPTKSKLKAVLDALKGLPGAALDAAVSTAVTSLMGG